MARALRNYEPVGPAFLDAGGSGHARASVTLPCSAETVFRCLEDGDAWCEWMGLTRVTWTSARPLSVGATRTVEAFGDTLEELFFTWEPGRCMAFCVVAGTNPLLLALAEEFKVTPLGATRCRLDYRGAMRMRLPSVMWVPAAALMGWVAARGFKRLANYLVTHADRYAR